MPQGPFTRRLIILKPFFQKHAEKYDHQYFFSLIPSFKDALYLNNFWSNGETESSGSWSVKKSSSLTSTTLVMIRPRQVFGSSCTERALSKPIRPAKYVWNVVAAMHLPWKEKNTSFYIVISSCGGCAGHSLSTIAFWSCWIVYFHLVRWGHVSDTHPPPRHPEGADN